MSSSREPENMQQPQTDHPESLEKSRERSERSTRADAVSEEVVHLPEAGTAPTPAADEDIAARFRPLDLFLVSLTAVLGFLLASYAISNNDFWLHLATGRYLSQNLGGLYTDPFTFVGANVTWVNHAWLFDLLIYGLYNLSGGMGLVIAKGIVIAALALVMLRTRVDGGGLWLSVVCVILALLALSGRLLFQPVLLSYLLLGLTLFLVSRRPSLALQASMPDPSKPEAQAKIPSKPEAQAKAHPPTNGKNPFLYLWLLPPLFILWVNLDGWFILGPLVLALALVGEAVQSFLAGEDNQFKALQRQRLKTLGLVFVVGLAACLVNPYFFGAFRLPAELGYLMHQLGLTLPVGMADAGLTLYTIEQYDPTFTVALFRSFFAPEYTEQLRTFNYLPGVFHFILLVVGGLSFVALLIAGKDDTRRFPAAAFLLIWLVFAALSLVMIRLMPFFAIVGGPIAAMNLQEALYRLRLHAVLPERLTLASNVAGRLAVLAAVVWLLFLIWPGWFRGPHGSGRSHYRVDWSIAVNPALQETAEALDKWSKEGKVKYVFNTEPDIACYMAWYSPDVKYLFDYRYELAAPKANELGVVRQSFLQGPQSNRPEDLKKWYKVLEAREQALKESEVSHVVFSWTGRVGVVARRTLFQLWGQPGRWQLASGNGRTMVYRWQPPGAADVKDAAVVDFEAMAFTKKDTPPETPDLVSFPQEVDFWTKYLAGEPQPSLGLQKVEFYLDNHRAQAAQKRMMHQLMFPDPYPVFAIDGFGFFAANLAAAPGSGGGHALTLALMQNLLPRPKLIAPQDESIPPSIRPEPATSLALPLLAVQSARQGVEATPNLDIAYGVLAEAVSHQWIVEQSYSDPIPQNRQLANEFIKDLQVDSLYYWTQANNQPIFSWRYELRHTAVVAAHQHRLTLEEDDLSHWFLAKHFLRDHMLEPRQPSLRTQYLDVVLHHTQKAKEQLEMLPQFNPLQKEMYKEIESFHAAFAKEVEDRRRYFRLQLSTLPPSQRFWQALFRPYKMKRQGKEFEVPLGLAEEALKVLDSPDAAKIPPAEKTQLLVYHLRLLTQLGRLHEAYTLLGKSEKDGLLPIPVAHEIRMRLAVAMGNYKAADESVRFFEEGHFNEIRTGLMPMLIDSTFSVSPHPAGVAIAAMDYLGAQSVLQDALLGVAEFRLVRGLMALEAGDVAAAEKHLQGVLDLVRRGDVFPDAILADRYLRQIREVNRKK